MVIRKPKTNFVEIRLDQSVPKNVNIQFISKITNVVEKDSKKVLTVTDGFGETEFEITASDNDDIVGTGNIIQIFARNGSEKLSILKIKKLEKFDFQSYKQVKSLGY